MSNVYLEKIAEMLDLEKEAGIVSKLKKLVGKNKGMSRSNTPSNAWAEADKSTGGALYKARLMDKSSKARNKEIGRSGAAYKPKLTRVK